MSMRQTADLPATTIERAFDGDSAAFREFYEHYDPVVRWAVGLRLQRLPSLGLLFEDIVQEVWSSLIRENCKVLRSYDFKGKVPFGRFFAFVSSRLVWRHAKRHRSHEYVPMAQDDYERDETGIVTVLERADFLERLLQRVQEHLDDADRSLIRERYGHGEPIGGVAARLGMSENTVYQRLRRLEKKILTWASSMQAELQVSPEYTLAHDGVVALDGTWETASARRDSSMRTSAAIPREELLTVTVGSGVEPALVERFLDALQATFAFESSGTLELRRSSTTGSAAQTHPVSSNGDGV